MTDSSDPASEFRELLDADAPDAPELQSRVRKGGADARSAVVALAEPDVEPPSLRYRAAVLAADACADDAPLRRILAEAAADPSAPVFADLTDAAASVARADGRAMGILTDAAVTADLLASAIDARPEDARIARAVLESLGDASGFTVASRPVRSRENAAKVLRNGMTLLARSGDDDVQHRLEQVLLARMTNAASATNDDILRAVLASPSGRGPALIEDLARGSAPGVQRQAQRMIIGGASADDSPEPPSPGETSALLLEIAQLQGEPDAPRAPEPQPESERGSEPESRPQPRPQPDLAPAPARKRSWLARLFARRAN